MKRVIQYKNGHTLSYAECGEKNGYPILAQHGLIASISDYHLFDSLIKAGIRVISIARPGYGESSPYHMSQMAEWGEIVSLLVDELDLSQFDLLGMSSGAPYSYAIGYKLPDRVRNIFILSGIPALYDDNVLAVWPFPVNKDAGIAELEKLAKELFFSDLSQEALLQNDIQDSMRHNCFGLALDFKLRCNSWGFLLSDVKQNVYMQHSRTDNFASELLNSFIETTVLPKMGV
jgi:pimeloyl-ACP methyl ester carboxylesterase